MPFVILTMFLAACSSSSHSSRPISPRGDWELLGSRQVSFGAERDVIGARHQGRFRAIKIEVERGNLEMFDVRVVFRNGESFSPDTRIEFREGSWSRTIDLPGDARIIDRIEFRYRSEVRRGRAVVKVWGR